MQTADQINLAIAIFAAASTLMSLALVVATFKILSANRETVSVMKEQVLAMTRPYIQVSPWVRVGSTMLMLMLMLTIRDAGANPAHKLKLTLDRDFYFNAESSEGKNLRHYTAFVHPIESLPPKAEISFHLGPGHAVFGNADRCPLRFRVSAEYEFDGGRVTETTLVDLQPFMYSAQPIDPVAEQLEKLNQHVSAIQKKLQ